MTHINTLYDNDLYDIFHLVLGEPPSNLDEWKKQLPLLQVCRKWYDMLYHYVYSRGFINIYSKGVYDTFFRSSNSCVYYSNDELVCRSNLGIITGRNEYNCKCVSSVRVAIYWDLTILQYGPVLIELLNLGVGYWLSLTSLELVGYTNDNEISDADKRLQKQLIATARKHILALKSKAPNITRLHIQWTGDRAFYMIPVLIEKYGDRLQYLDSNCPIQRLPFLYSDELTHLTLNLEKLLYKLPKIYPKPLRHLHLRYVPGDFTWHCFHDDLTTGRIEFTNLETFILVYQDQTDDQKAKSLEYSKRARPYGSYMLRFPKLSELTIENCPVDCDILFTDTMPSHIKLLDIDGDGYAIVASSKMGFEKVNDLIVQAWGQGTLSNEFYEAANYYFRKLQISGKCSLVLYQSLDVQRTGSWVNLQHLYVKGILFNDLLKLIPKLCNLQGLDIGRIDLGDEFTSIIEHGREDEKHGRIKCLKTKTADISIRDVKPESLDDFVDCANHLLARMPTVGKFESSEDINIRESFLPTKFPHVEFSIVPYPFLLPYI